MKKDLLLEIGLEEMPSAFLPQIIKDFQKNSEQKLKEHRLFFDNVKILATPRRLVLKIAGLNEQQEDAIIENRGPKKKAAFDNEGQPTKAAQGFARGQGLPVEALEVREVGGVEYLFAIKTEKGLPTEEFIGAILMEIVFSIPLPKSMRWGYFQTRFVRPVRWILAMYGEKYLELQIENVVSGKVTYGHRFLSKGALNVNGIEEYFTLLRDHYVILDQDERRELIREQVKKVAAAVDGQAMQNEDLLEEICYLVEYPTAFHGDFSADYLQVPVEVLTTTMMENQKYFPVFDKNGALMPVFIGVRNGNDYALDIVKAGNERVIKARLEDALFFWKEDTGKKLADFNTGLKAVLYHERLGTLEDKVKRLQKLAVFIGAKMQKSNAEDLARAAYLCKADLLSAMVFEFPELQGVMGRYYALNSGEKDEVAQAITEHYMPRFAGDKLPLTETGIVLALTEKIDNLVGCFAIGIKPTGSQDPYALRRQALGIINIILEQGIEVDLKAVFAFSYQCFAGIKLDLEEQAAIDELIDFISLRMKGVLQEKGFAYDLIDAVLNIKSGDIKNIIERISSIEEFKAGKYFEDFMVVFNRAHNLTKKWHKDEIIEEFLQEKSEQNLYKKLQTTAVEYMEAYRNKNYIEAMQKIAGIRPELDEFFAQVMVMVEDEGIKAARLGLLKRIVKLSKNIADFTFILQ